MNKLAVIDMLDDRKHVGWVYMTTLIESNMIVDVRISTLVQTCIPKSVVP